MYGGGLGYYGMDMSYVIFIIPALLLTMYAQGKISSTFNRYSQIASNSGYTGSQVARIILDRNGLHEVAIERVQGNLTDHYDPRTRVLRLSSPVYNSSSVAAISVAAHEVGHAIQHSEGYAPLSIRNTLVPVANFGSRISWLLIVLGFVVSNTLINIGIILFLGVVLFQLITLPVEFNASNRALEQLENGVAPRETIPGAKKVLNAAALTYVAAAFTAIAQLARIILLSNRRRRD